MEQTKSYAGNHVQNTDGVGTLDQQTKEWLDQVYGKIETKMEWVSEKSKDKIPYLTINGVHDDRSDLSKKWNENDGLNWWTNGFWGGILWMLYHATGKTRFAEIARISEEKMDACFNDYYGLHHDVGFMWRPTAAADYDLTQNPESRKRALHAANLLAGRFNPVGNYIRAWNDIPGSSDDTRGWAIIDCMLNLSLLYWASEETGDPRFRQIAMLHADMAQKYFVRPDGDRRICALVWRSGLCTRIFLDTWPGLGCLWFYDQLYSYGQKGISSHGKAYCSLYHRKYTRRWHHSS